MAEELTFRKETVEISGGRNLYRYTFVLNRKPMPEMRAQDVIRNVEPEASDSNPKGNLSAGAPEHGGSGKPE
jgi:hypothetical protein